MPEIKTPPNMPRIAKVIKFWSYRTFFDATRRGGRPGSTQLYRMSFDIRQKPEVAEELETFREQLAAVTSPEYPQGHIDNHSGWEVELKNGTIAFVLFSDLNCTMYAFPPAP
jgi:hypothetical protein